MSRLRLPAAPAAAARPLQVSGAVLVLVGALLPWATFVLNDGAYPGKATLPYFDAPLGLEEFRRDVAVLGLAALVASFVPMPARHRVLRALGWGAVAMAVVNDGFLVHFGGGLGAVTVDGTAAFGGLVTLVGGALLIAGAVAGGLEEPVHLPVDVPWPAAWSALVAAFGSLLLVVATTLTAGGQGGVANPYAGAAFLSYLAFVGGVYGALHGAGVVQWIGELSERHRLFSLAVLLLCAVGLPFTGAGNEYWMTVAANIGVYAATAIGLNVVVGLAGLLDLGYVAFLGIGAFVAANLSGAVASRFDVSVPFPLAALAAAVTAGLFGSVVGSPTLRVRGDYLAIVTLAFGEIFVRSAQNDIGGLTGGPNAIPGIPPVAIGGLGFDEAVSVGSVRLPSGVLYYFMIVFLVSLVMLIFANLKHSRIGRAWIAIREDEDVARAMGIHTGKAKILAFMTGATLAGLAGSVFAHKLGTASYDSFKFLESVTLLAAVILGGMGSISGAVLGSSLLFVLPEKLREFSDYRLLIFGLALVLIMRFRPQGLVPDRHRRAELADEDAEGRPLEQVATEAEHLPVLRASTTGPVRPVGPTSGPVLEARGVTMQFGGLTALNDVSLSLQRGQVLGLIGPNGAGKTTFFNCLTGLYTPTRGEVTFGGRRLPGDPALVTAAGVARTFQNIRLFPSMTALENVMVGRHVRMRQGPFSSLFHGRAYARGEAAARARAWELLDFVGLRRMGNDLARSLPYGDQRRLEIARALATDPQVLLLDEPTAGMNPQETDAARRLIMAIRESGVAVVVIEHDTKFIFSLCDSVSVLVQGELLVEGPPEVVRDDPRVIEAYLGKPPEEVAAEVAEAVVETGEGDGPEGAR